MLPDDVLLYKVTPAKNLKPGAISSRLHHVLRNSDSGNLKYIRCKMDTVTDHSSLLKAKDQRRKVVSVLIPPTTQHAHWSQHLHFTNGHNSVPKSKCPAQLRQFGDEKDVPAFSRPLASIRPDFPGRLEIGGRLETFERAFPPGDTRQCQAGTLGDSRSGRRS
jgi:hypothetical protein